ncbi:polysaccharide biosynthesis tyrosine autokinase [Streptomyces sp. NPDC087440]|uniref:polysaccharide biosynthesis tyrosine autokinase n=1 Tax=Streptomyces sp. NPDC087440 TaxID=3365790 RepID=UPI0037F51F6F
MNIRDFLGVLGRRWITVLTLLTAGALAGGAATWLTTPVYRAEAKIFVSARAVADAQQLAQISNFGQDRVQSYADIARSAPVLTGAINELGLTGTLEPAELAERVEAVSPLGTVLVDIAVRDSDPERAAAIANAVSLSFADTVEKLETPLDGGKVPVKLSVAEFAAVPGAPQSPRPLLNYAAGILGGLLLGCGFAVLRENLDTTIGSASALGDVLGLPVFGTIPLDKGHKGKPDEGFVVAQGVRSLRAEAYRQLRTNLQFAAVDQRPTVIAVTSALPGEGKTSTSVNLAAAIALDGRSVCLVDADLRRPRVAGHLGLVEGAGLTSVLVGAVELTDVLQNGPGGMKVLAAGEVPPNPAELLASGQMGVVLAELAGRFDAVIVDTAPVLPVADTVALVPRTDGVVLVVRAGKTGRDQASTAADTLRGVGGRLIGAVLSMAPERRGPGAYGTYGSYQPYEVPAQSGSARLAGSISGAGWLARIRPRTKESAGTVGAQPTASAASSSSSARRADR